jgi:hypothetical protein
MFITYTYDHNDHGAPLTSTSGASGSYFYDGNGNRTDGYDASTQPTARITGSDNRLADEERCT